MNRKKYLWVGVWLVLFVATSVLAFGRWTRDDEFGYWHGWGRMHGWGGYHHRWPGDGDRGNVLPYWHGMGPGMMDGYRYGRGRTDGDLSWLPQNLSDEQRRQARQLIQESASENRKLQQQHEDAHDRLQQLYASDQRDWTAIRAAVMELADLQARQLKAAIDLEEKIDGLQRDSQRKPAR